MHCLPAHRGEEVSAEVIESPQSIVWQQASNRMDSIRALFVDVLSERSEQSRAEGAPSGAAGGVGGWS
jgi:aspartate carbamoyltransferase catalytic subunit